MENTKSTIEANKLCLFDCKLCEYITSKKFNLDKHFLTSKHKKLLEVAKNVGNVGNVGKIEDIEKVYKCDCGKEYKHAPSLWNHKKLCIYKEPEISLDIINNENPLINVVNDLLKNNEFKMKLIDLISKTLKTVGSTL